MFRRISALQLAFDLALAALCVAVRLAIGVEPRAMVVAVALMGLALAANRLSPALALAIAWGGALIQMYAGAVPDSANLAILVVLYSTARHGSALVKWCGLASAGVGGVTAALYVTFRRPGYIADGQPVFVGTPQELAVQLLAFGLGFLAVLGLSWTLGLLAKTWANARESRRRQTLAERSVVIEQERNRIARDMHDVVAHSLAVVIAQADGARYATGVKSKDAALGTISSTARGALADVRLLLGQLRHSEEAGPQPVVADLEKLVEQLRSSGLSIHVEQHGAPIALGSGQQLAVYRIVQEALTNALRHGDTAKPVTVAVEWSRDAATATITSALRAASAAPAEGHGIAGMRERALLVGGNLTAAVDGDTFVVRARIPGGAGTREVHAGANEVGAGPTSGTEVSA